MIRFILICSLLICSFTIQAQEILRLTNQEEVFLRQRYISVFEDKTGKVTLDEITSGRYDGNFQPPPGLPLIKNPSSNYWLKFRAVSDFTNQYLMECFTFKVNTLEVYIPGKNGQIERHEASNLKNFEQRRFNHKNFEFFLPVDTLPRTFYVKVKNSEPIRLTLVVRSLQRFTGYALSEYFLLGLYYGIILIIAFYNIFLFISIKERAHLFYLFYVLSVGLYSMSQDGTGFQYLWPSLPVFNNFSTGIFLYSLIFWMMMYAREFLSIPEKMKILNRIILGYLLVRASVGIIGLIWIPLSGNFIFIDLIPFFIAYLCSFRSFKSGFAPAKYFIAGFSVLFIAFLISGLMYAKLIVNNVYTVYAVNVGVVLEMVFLSVALAERVKIFREDKLLKEQENHALEEMVSLRTKELELANEKLKTQAEEIAAMNRLLHDDNRKLADNVKRIAEDRVMQKQMDFEEFKTIYPGDNDCLAYLAGLKWEKGYTCVRCENSTFLTGKNLFSRRCTKCGYDESASACTIFHGIKFPLTKAFYMLFLVTENTEITIEQLSEKLELTTKTCWGFRKKITEALDGAKGKKVKGSRWTSVVLQNPKKTV